jgi:hypothetical protein
MTGIIGRTKIRSEPERFAEGLCSLCKLGFRKGPGQSRCYMPSNPSPPQGSLAMKTAVGDREGVLPQRPVPAALNS